MGAHWPDSSAPSVQCVPLLHFKLILPIPICRNAVVTILHLKEPNETDAILHGFGIEDFPSTLADSRVWTNNDALFCAILVQVRGQW